MTRLLALLVAGTLGCFTSTAPQVTGVPPDATVLFVGNSLTYWNDLPAMVQAIADSARTPGVRVAMVAFPDYALADHLMRGDALQVIRRGGWNTVVLQQGPSALDASRAQLRRDVAAFAAEIRRAGGRPALYAPWPAQSRAADFAPSAESYRLAAADVDALLMPVGEAWQAAWARDATLGLYGPDGLHPSPLGSLVAAVVIHAQVAGGAPYVPTHVPCGPGCTIISSAAQRTLIAEAARDVLGR